MHELELIAPVAVLLVAGVVAVTLSHRCALPAVVGYFVIGAAIGPHGLALVEEGATVAFLAELGVVFLLFDIGLHFSLKSLWATRRELFGLGPLQMVLSALALGAVARLGGLLWESAILVAATLALSSTAVVLQTLPEPDRRGSPLGRAATAVLIFQDLFALVLLVLVALPAGERGSVVSTVAWVALETAGAVALMALAGRLVRPLFLWVTRHGEEAAFTATVLLIVLATAGGAAAAGLSMALGAFLAGMLLSESEYCYRVKTDIKPFRALLLGLFFLTVGMSLDLGRMVASFAQIVAIVLGLVALKALCAALAARLAGTSTGFAVHLGFLLAQGSEFAFVVFRGAQANGSLPGDLASVLMTAVALSMALTPLAAWLGRRLGARIEARQAGAGAPAAAAAAGAPAADQRRVLLGGTSPALRTVARALRAADVDYVALEPDPQRLAEARAEGFQARFGSVDDPALLAAVGAADARALVLDGDEDVTLQRARVERVRAHYPSLDVLVGVPGPDQVGPLEEAGAGACEITASPSDTALGIETLRRLGVDAERIRAWANEFVDDPQWEKADKLHAY